MCKCIWNQRMHQIVVLVLIINACTKYHVQGLLQLQHLLGKQCLTCTSLITPPRKRKEKSFAKTLLLKFLFSPETLQELLQSSTSMAVDEVSCDDHIFAAI